MSYLVLARKWRPQRFEDVVGQGHVTRILTNAIRTGRIAHAYLFAGVRGVGKTTAARILAKALNCEKGPTPEPCGECGQCREIKEGISIDVYEIDGASNTGIDNVREIIENVRYQPAKSRFKIYIIDEVHQISKAAFNALLKTLEEPPPFVKFILATTEPHRLPDTILSRCQRFDFRRIPVRDIAQRLREIGKEEDLKITDRALLVLAREAEGSMRDAQSLLEHVLSYADLSSAEKERKTEIDERLLQEIMGIAERGILYEVSQAVMRGDARRCIELVADATVQGLDLARLSRELVEHFRNLLVVRLGQERRPEDKSSGDRSTGLLDLTDQEIEDLGRQVSQLSVDMLMDYFTFMAEGDEEVARSAYPRFALEAVLARLATLPMTIPITDVLKRLEMLEQKLSKEGPARPVPRPDEEPAFQRPERGKRRIILEDEPPAPQPAAAPPGERAGGGGEKAEVWKSFVAFVMREKKVLASYLEQVTPLELAPGKLVIGVEDRHYLKYLQDPENLSLLKDFARLFFSADVAISVSPLTSEYQENPVVKETLRIFGGSIVKKEG